MFFQHPKQLIKVCSILSLICVPLFLFGQGNERFQAFKVVKYFADANAKFEAGEFPDAIEDYSVVVELDPQHASVFKARGDAYYKMRKYNEARGDYSKAIRQQPQDATLYNSRGLVYAELGYYTSAIRDFDRALRLSPNYSEAETNKEEVEKKMRLAENRTKAHRPNRTNSTRDWEADGWEETQWGDENKNQSYRDRDEGSGAANKIFKRTKTYHRPRVAGRPADYISIEHIKVNANGTEVTFRIKSPRNKVVSFKLHRPGTKEAFYLTDRTFRKKYKLKSQKGLAGWDREIRVYGGKSQSFVLRFDKISSRHRYIHIVEGNNEGEEAWNFYDVELKSN